LPSASVICSTFLSAGEVRTSLTACATSETDSEISATFSSKVARMSMHLTRSWYRETFPTARMNCSNVVLLSQDICDLFGGGAGKQRGL